MSDTRHIDPGGRQKPWRRWEMDELRPPQASPGSHSPPDGNDPAAERRRHEGERRQADLDALRQQATQEGRDAGYREGFESGHREGVEKGLEEGRQQAQQELEARKHELLAPLGELAQQFSTALDTLDDTIAEDLADLALETGRKLAGEALKEQPCQVLDVVRKLLHTDPPLMGQQRLWLHPQDHALVERHLGEELSAAGWALQPDDQISRGGCRVTSASGELDATWETRWQAIESQVRRRPSQAPSHRTASTDREEEHS